MINKDKYKTHLRVCRTSFRPLLLAQHIVPTAVTFAVWTKSGLLLVTVSSHQN